MTIPVSPASERRGPRETLLALTETYLRRGELDPEARHAVASLAARVSSRESLAPGLRCPDPPVASAPGPGAPMAGADATGSGSSGARDVGSPAIPEWAPLACALAALLRGEAEYGLRVVTEALRAEGVPEALRPALLRLGIRAALAADRPALVARWRAGLRRSTEGRAPRPEESTDAANVYAAGGTGPGVATGAKRVVPPPARPHTEDMVRSSLPPDVRALLEPEVGEGGVMEGPQPPASGGAVGAEGRTSEGAASVHGAVGVQATAADDRQRSGDAAARSSGRDRKDGGDAEPGARGQGAGGPPSDTRAPATLHLVMNAYHGDVVSVPARVEVLSWRPSEVLDDDGADGGDLEPGREAAASAVLLDWEAEGLPLLTVRVASRDALPVPPDVEGWHLRFVGRLRALDARSSDGSLLDLAWEDGGFVATFHPPDWLEELPDAPPVVATRVTHVVLVPEMEVGREE